MSAQALQSALESSLTGVGTFSDELFQDVLVDFLESLHASANRDADDALICVVAEDDEVALLLIEWDGAELKNEAALVRMKEMWKHNFAINMRTLIPIFVSHLAQRNLGVAGVKWVKKASE